MFLVVFLRYSEISKSITTGVFSIFGHVTCPANLNTFVPAGTWQTYLVTESFCLGMNFPLTFQCKLRWFSVKFYKNLHRPSLNQIKSIKSNKL